MGKHLDEVGAGSLLGGDGGVVLEDLVVVRDLEVTLQESRNSNMEALRGFSGFTWVLVPEPLMPEVALVEFPPQKGLLSRSSTLPPFSRTV